jgi:hypothetical protein
MYVMYVVHILFGERCPVIHRPNPEEFALASELRKCGVPFDEDQFERMRVDPCALSIRQGGVPNRAFNLFPREAGFIFSVEISNDSSHNLSRVDIEFDGPFYEFGMRLLLPDRVKKSRKPFYSMPAPRLERYERDMVLNHLVNRRHTWRPGKTVEGLLLAVAETRIPWEYYDRERLEVGVTVFDQRGRSDRKSFWLIVDWTRDEKEFMQERLRRQKAFDDTSPDEIRAKKLAVAERLGVRVEDNPEWFNTPAPSASPQTEKEVANDLQEPAARPR